jgi:hypothetical protein
MQEELFGIKGLGGQYRIGSTSTDRAALKSQGQIGPRLPCDTKDLARKALTELFFGDLA